MGSCGNSPKIFVAFPFISEIHQKFLIDKSEGKPVGVGLPARALRSTVGLERGEMGYIHCCQGLQFIITRAVANDSSVDFKRI